MDGIMIGGNSINKLAFSTLPCDGWTPLKLLHFCTEYGFSGIELRESEGTWISADLCSEERAYILKLFERERIKITDIASSACLSGDNKKYTEVMNNLKRIIHLADDLNARGVRIFLGSFSPVTQNPGGTIDFEAIAGQVQQVCDYAAQLNREIWIETHNEFSKGSILRKLLDIINRKNCCVIWDIMHTLEAGDKSEDTLKYIGTECMHVHIKDGVKPKDQAVHEWTHTIPGSGEIPIAQIIYLLMRYGYNGYFSFEWESKWRKELQSPGFEAETVLPIYAGYMKKILNEAMI